MSVKAKTRKRLVVLLAATVGLAGLAGVGWAYHLHRKAAWYAQERSLGMEAAARGDAPEAVRHLAAWLGQNPDDAEALTAYVKERPLVQASDHSEVWDTIGRLRRLVELRQDDDGPRRQLMGMYARYGFLTEAKDTAEAILARHPGDAEATKVKYESLVRLRQWDEARKLAEAWAKADPGNPEPVLRVLAVLAQTDRPAQEVVDRAKAFGAKDPGAPAAQVVLGVAYRMTGDLASAQKQLKLAAAQEPPTPALARVLMDQLNRAGLYEESMDLLQRMAKKSPEEVETRRALVRRMWEMGRASDVVALTAQKGASKLGEEEMGLRAMALAQLGKKDEAKQELARLQGDQGNALAAAWAAAVSLATDPAGSVEPRKLLDLCQRAAMQDSEGAYLRYYVGHAYAQLDEPDLAIEAWQGVAQQNATWALPLVRLSDAELAKGRYAQSMQAAQMAMRRSHGSALAAVNMAKVWAANVEAGKGAAGHEEELLKFVSEIRKQLPGDEQMLTVQVSLLAKMGKKDEATAEIRKALAAKDAPSEQTLMRLAAASRAYDLGVTDACYDRSEQAHGVTANLAFARAVGQFGHGQGAAGLAGLKAARERSGKAGDLDWELAWARYLEVTQDPAAKEAWEKLADARPEDRQVQQLALGVKSTRADRAFIDRTIDRLRKLTGDAGVTWKLARARWMLEGAKTDQDLAQAVVLLKDVVRAANDLVEPRVLLAQAYERLKDPNGAVEQLRSAAAADPSNTQVALYLSQLLQKRGEYDKARQELDRVAKNEAADPAQKRQAAAMLAQQGDAEGAIKLLQEGGGEDAAGKDGRSDLLLAMLYRQRNELDKADALAEKMLASNPEPAVVQFAADLYAQQGRRADADKALARLDKMGLKPGAKELILADHASRYLGPDEAVKHFKAALAAEPGNATAWRALAGYYAYLGRGKEMAETAEAGLKQVPADATLKEISARKELLSAAAGDAETRPLVSAYLADPRADAPALAVMQALAAARQGGEPADQTAAKLKKLVDANPTFEPAQLILVGRYARMGRTDDAAQLASRAVQMFPSDPEPARLAVEAMSAGQRWAEALGFAKTWRERALSNPMPADLAIAACQLQLGQAAAAAETVAPYVPAAVAKPDHGGAGVIVQYAAALTSAGQGEKAAGVLWPLAEKSGEWRRVWMQAALRLPATQATGWLDRAAAAIPADAQDERTALAEAWHVLGTRGPDAKATAKADAIFAELLARPDVKSGTALSRGIAAEQEKDLATAETAYRRALALDPNSVVAQNNLAMVLLKKDGGDVAEATRLAKAAVEKNPQAATLHDTLAQAQARGKDVDGAAASLRKALELEPNSLEWHVHLARVLLDGGRRKEADKVMQAIATLPVGRTPPSEQTQKQLDQLRAEMSKQTAASVGGG